MVTRDLKSLIGRLNESGADAIQRAIQLASTSGHPAIDVAHLVAGLLEQADGDVAAIADRFGIDRDEWRGAVLRHLDRIPEGRGGRPNIAGRLQGLLERSWLLASVDHGLMAVRTGAIVRALLEGGEHGLDGEAGRPLDLIDRETLRRDFTAILARSSERGTRVDHVGTAQPAPADAERAPGGAPVAEEDLESLHRFTVDITQQAQDGELDPVLGRDAEIRQIVDVLARRRKNNPLLIGEPGVGKSAVVEGLARKLVSGDVPLSLKGVRLRALDLGMLKAGASVKGEFEKRLRGVISALEAERGATILFIDEAHTLIGAGGEAGTGDAANLLKPALARGALRTIGATTFSEYKKYIEKDPALERRFQVIQIEEPSVEDAAKMLRGVRDAFESHHGVRILDRALVAAAELSHRYVAGRQLPDKAVDLVDTAAARVAVSLNSRPAQIDVFNAQLADVESEAAAVKRDVGEDTDEGRRQLAELDRRRQEIRESMKALEERWNAEREAIEHIRRLRAELDQAKGELEEARNASDWTRVAELTQGAIRDLRQQMSDAEARLGEVQGEDPLLRLDVDEEAIARVVADFTGIPAGKMVEDDAEVMLRLEDLLLERIRGQDPAVEAVAKALRVARADLQDPDAPIGTFLFVGTSGVGKTELARAVAETVFGGERFLIQLNMSEYMEKHTVSRLIGSPPGYVGYGEGGVLTEAVRRQPYSVVLLDEVEKAHPDILNLFYQVFDRGECKDGEGRYVNFRNTIIFMTSNLGTPEIEALSEEDQRDAAKLREAIEPALSRFFKPALLARFTVVPFRPLPDEIIRQIVRIKVDKVARRLRQRRDTALELSDAAIEMIAAAGQDRSSGARAIDHVINGQILPVIGRQIVTADARKIPYRVVRVDVDPEGALEVRLDETVGAAPSRSGMEDVATDGVA